MRKKFFHSRRLTHKFPRFTAAFPASDAKSADFWQNLEKSGVHAKNYAVKYAAAGNLALAAHPPFRQIIGVAPLKVATDAMLEALGYADARDLWALELSAFGSGRDVAFQHFIDISLLRQANYRFHLSGQVFGQLGVVEVRDCRLGKKSS